MIKRTLKETMKLELRQPKLNKQCEIAKYTKQLETGEYDVVQARCSEVLIMSNKEYTEFSNKLMCDFKFLEGLKAGTGSDYEPEDTEATELYQLSREEFQRWCSMSYRLATMIYNKDADEKFYVNTEGYSYARYCLFD